MIKETTCYYAVCDVCGFELNEEHCFDKASAIEFARDYHELFVTDDGMVLCTTSDPQHREQALRNLELFAPDERKELIDYYALNEETDA